MKQKLFILLLLLPALACKKDADEFTGAIPGKLEKIYYHRNADQVRVYKYSEQGQLASYEYWFDQVLIERHDYTYQDNKLIRIQDFERFQDGKPLSLVQDRTLSYDEHNRLVQVAIGYINNKPHSGGIIVYPSRYEFGYTGSATRFTTVKTFAIDDSQTEPVAEAALEYDVKGNISRITTYTVADQVKTLAYTTSYSYAAVVNPHYRFESPLDYVAFYSPDLCTGIVATGADGQQTYNYAREYEQADGKLTYTRGTDADARWYEYYK
ncbi:MAG: hypothetical protein P0Y53_10110 [Candidatus Pseudobacter hemicellulosilyticus]|uniref:Uncharacterized protein n=1 Tax=Candidatus Pseudobacter hemicellulosilyticus TaxID=3121375 RepID=A0AAJ5WTC6_9BACT|nr:MAG: hypothetical protein P0Y53_10110 [Pseudobacter sp.]